MFLRWKNLIISQEQKVFTDRYTESRGETACGLPVTGFSCRVTTRSPVDDETRSHSPPPTDVHPPHSLHEKSISPSGLLISSHGLASCCVPHNVWLEEEEWMGGETEEQLQTDDRLAMVRRWCGVAASVQTQSTRSSSSSSVVRRSFASKRLDACNFVPVYSRTPISVSHVQNSHLSCLHNNCSSLCLHMKTAALTTHTTRCPPQTRISTATPVLVKR